MKLILKKSTAIALAALLCTCAAYSAEKRKAKLKNAISLAQQEAVVNGKTLDGKIETVEKDVTDLRDELCTLAINMNNAGVDEVNSLKSAVQKMNNKVTTFDSNIYLLSRHINDLDHDAHALSGSLNAHAATTEDAINRLVNRVNITYKSVNELLSWKNNELHNEKNLHDKNFNDLLTQNKQLQSELNKQRIATTTQLAALKIQQAETESALHTLNSKTYRQILKQALTSRHGQWPKTKKLAQRHSAKHKKELEFLQAEETAEAEAQAETELMICAAEKAMTAKIEAREKTRALAREQAEEEDYFKENAEYDIAQAKEDRAEYEKVLAKEHKDFKFRIKGERNACYIKRKADAIKAAQEAQEYKE